MCPAGTSEPKDCTAGSYCEVGNDGTVDGSCTAGLCLLLLPYLKVFLLFFIPILLLIRYQPYNTALSYLLLMIDVPALRILLSGWKCYRHSTEVQSRALLSCWFRQQDSVSCWQIQHSPNCNRSVSLGAMFRFSWLFSTVCPPYTQNTAY